MDYGKRSYGSPANNQPTYIQEITDQYIQSIGGIWPADFKRPYVYSSYTEMQYLFNSPVVYTGGEAPLLEDLDVELDPLIPVPSDPYDPDIPPVWPTPKQPPIPDDDDEDEDECICGGAYIQYTSSQMACDEEQTLQVRGDRSCVYTWVIESGDGSFEYYTTDSKHAIGISVNYIAPSSNANCSSNPLISLYCNGVFANALSIAVNCYTGANWAYQSFSAPFIYKYQCEGYYTKNTECMSYRSVYQCNGERVYYCGIWRYKIKYTKPCPTLAECTASTKGGAMCGVGDSSIDTVLTWGHDLRSAGMISGGCCPYQLL